MPPKRGAKREKPKNVGKKSNFVEKEQQDENEQRNSGSDGEVDHVASDSIEPKSKSNANGIRGKGKKLVKQLTYTAADDEFAAEKSKSTEPQQKIQEESDVDMHSDEENHMNGSHSQHSDGEKSGNDDVDLESTVRISEKESDDESMSETEVKAEQRGKPIPQTTDNESDSDEEEPPKNHHLAKPKGKLAPQLVKDMTAPLSDEDESSEDDEPPKKVQSDKSKSKSVAETARNMPALSTEEDESEQDDEKATSDNQTQTETESENESDEVADEADEAQARAVPSKGAKTVKSAPKQQSKAPVLAPRNAKGTKSKPKKDESIFDIPEQKKPRMNTRNKANQDDQEIEKPKAKTAPPKKATATTASAKPALKRGANIQSDDEEDDERPQIKASGRATRKQLVMANKDGKENSPPKRTTKSGKTASASKPIKPSKKEPVKPKKKVDVEEVDSDADGDSATPHEMSMHIKLPSRSTIGQKISEATKLLVGKNGRCTLKELLVFLEKENQFDVKKNEDKVKSQLKQMFETKEIVPVNRIKGKPAVTVVFKLSSIKNKPISSEKRKSILMAAKKKKQNENKSSKPAVKLTGGKKSSKKTAKQTTEDTDLEQFDDDEDVPPKHR